MNDLAPSHLVEDLRFEVAFDHEDPALDQQARLASFVKGPALRIVDEVFEALDLPGDVLQLDRLVIDLGDVPAAEMEQHWSLRLRQRLYEALADLGLQAAVHGHERPSDDGTRRRSLRDARRAALLGYLRFGRLPWHSGRRSDAHALLRWARDWLDTEPDSLVAALRAAGGERVARRLALQWPAAWTAHLLGHLAPGTTEAELARRTATEDARERWLRLALADVPPAAPVPSPMRPVTPVAPPAAKALPATPPSPAEPLPPPAAPAPTTGDLARQALLRVRLAAALTGTPTERLGVLWRALHDEDAPGLRRLLARLMPDVPAAAAVARHLAPPMLGECLQLWLPSADVQSVLTALPAPQAPDHATAVAPLLTGLARAEREGRPVDPAWRTWAGLETAAPDDAPPAVVVAPEPAPEPAPAPATRAVSTTPATPPVAALPPAPPPPVPPPAWVAEALAEAEAAATWFIDSAGLVIAHPFLPRLLEMLEFTDGLAFRTPEAAERAVLLLEYVTTGETETPEPLLALHKLLCGLPLETPVARRFEPTAAERSAVEGMLQALIAHWKIIGKTSVAGLRSSFLQREGRLEDRADRGWHLHVDSRSFDMLLDQLPWSYTPVKYPWMPEVLHVEWR